MDGQGGPLDTQSPQPLGDGLLGPIEAREEDAAAAFQQVGHEVAGLQLQRQRRRDQLARAPPAACAVSDVTSSTGRPQCPSSIASASA